MAASKASDGPQPEMLKGLEAAARSGGAKPKEHGLEATAETAPKPASLKGEEARAAAILKKGAEETAAKGPRR